MSWSVFQVPGFNQMLDMLIAAPHLLICVLLWNRLLSNYDLVVAVYHLVGSFLHLSG